MIERSVQLTLPHRVFFTEDAFAVSNPVLGEALRLPGEPPKQRPRKALVVLEEQVLAGNPELAGRVRQWFAARDGLVTLAAEPLVIPGGEPCKNDWRLVERLWAAINDAGIDRHSHVIAVGGGALLDLTGFAAATAHRGVRLVRMPTTTLSQADGGVGVKNGVNFFRKKNWVGTFNVPAAVVNDFTLLDSLPEQGRRDGVIEAIKVALIRDKAFFEELEAGAEALAGLEKPMLRRLIRRSAELHVEHICTGGDPFEFGSARPLDFGHWIAHKLEQLSSFRVTHGQAVAIGMAADLIYAELAGLLSPEDCARILALIRRAGFKLWAEELLLEDESGKPLVLRGLEEFREHLGGELCVTLVTAPGKALEVHEMDARLVTRALTRMRRDYGEEAVLNPEPAGAAS